MFEEHDLKFYNIWLECLWPDGRWERLHAESWPDPVIMLRSARLGNASWSDRMLGAVTNTSREHGLFVPNGDRELACIELIKAEDVEASFDQFNLSLTHDLMSDLRNGLLSKVWRGGTFEEGARLNDMLKGRLVGGRRLPDATQWRWDNITDSS